MNWEDRADRSSLMSYVAADSPGEYLHMYDGGAFQWVVMAGHRVYRFPRSDEGLEALTVEARFLQRFAKLSPVAVPVPEIHDDPIPHTVYDVVPGRPLWREELGRWDDEARREAADALAGFLNVLHGFPVEEARATGVREELPDAPGNWLDTRRSVLERLDPEARRIVEPLYARIGERWEAAPRRCVVHNDLTDAHIIVDLLTGRLTGVIDFGDVAVGDPALDFKFGSEYGEPFLQMILDRYEHPLGEDVKVRVRLYRIKHLLGYFRWGSTHAQRARNELVRLGSALLREGA